MYTQVATLTKSNVICLHDGGSISTSKTHIWTKENPWVIESGLGQKNFFLVQKVI